MGLALIIAAASFRDDMLRYFSLDDSWLVGLYEARHLGFHWGSDIVFTYGPLGFLERPLFLHPGSGFVALAVQLAFLTALAMFVAETWRRSIHPVAAWILAYLVVATVGWSTDIAALAAVLPVLHLTTTRTRRSRRFVLVVVVSAVAGALPLVKLSLLPMAGLVAVGAGLLLLRGDRRHRLAVVPVTALASFVGLWLLLGQRLGDLPRHVTSARSLASGYSQAMGAEVPLVDWEYRAATVLALVVIGTALLRLRPVDRSARVVAIVLVVATLAVAFRLGFVRHDQHAFVFFATVILLLAAMPPARGTSWRAIDGSVVRIGLLVVAVVVLNQAGLGRGSLLDGPELARSLPSRVREANDPEAKLRSLMYAAAWVDSPAKLIERVGEDPVHVEPWDSSLVASAGLRWQPTPVFQTYAAYTPDLDQINADAIADGGPRWILRRRGRAIDGRNPAWESPRYQQAVLCHYRVAGTERTWQLLERTTTDRCGPARPIAAPAGRSPGSAVVPRSGDDVVLVHITCPRSRLERGMEVIFKPRHVVWVEAAGGRFRVPPAHLASRLIVRSPDIRSDNLRVTGCAVPATFEFFAMTR